MGDEQRLQATPKPCHEVLLQEPSWSLLGTFLQATAKLCHEVLAPVLDGARRPPPAARGGGAASLAEASRVGQMELSAAAVHAVVSDSLRLLACKEAKVGSGPGASADEPAEDGNAAAAAARGKVLSQVARKATVEAIVPIVVELKRHLEAAHSPLLRDVSLFVRELLRDHKPLLADILARDKQLATEIEYDMKQLDRRDAAEMQPRCSRDAANFGRDAATLGRDGVRHMRQPDAAKGRRVLPPPGGSV